MYKATVPRGVGGGREGGGTKKRTGLTGAEQVCAKRKDVIAILQVYNVLEVVVLALLACRLCFEGALVACW